MPAIEINSSLKVSEIYFGEAVSIAFCFGLDETSAVCAFATGELKSNSAEVKAIERFIVAKGISRRDIKRPSVARTTEGPVGAKRPNYRGGNLLFVR